MIGIFGSLGKLTLFVFNTKFNVECQEFSLFLAGVFVCVCVCVCLSMCVQLKRNSITQHVHHQNSPRH